MSTTDEIPSLLRRLADVFEQRTREQDPAARYTQYSPASGATKRFHLDRWRAAKKAGAPESMCWAEGRLRCFSVEGWARYARTAPRSKTSAVVPVAPATTSKEASVLQHLGLRRRSA